MNYVKNCLIVMMLAGIGYAHLGDLNCDATVNVLDVVILSVCVLTQTCDDISLCSWCTQGSGSCQTSPSHPADMNEDGGYNVLDIVTLANCIMVNSSNPVDECG